MSRYYATKKRVNYGIFSFSRWVVRCGDSTWNLFVGRKWSCHRMAAELNRAFNDGVYVGEEFERSKMEHK